MALLNPPQGYGQGYVEDDDSCCIGDCVGDCTGDGVLGNWGNGFHQKLNN